MTSNSPTCSVRYLAPSAKWTVRRGSVQWLNWGKNCFEASTTILSISTSTTRFTDLCFSTSPITAPSPPPMISTFSGLWCTSIAGCEIIS